MTDKQQTATNIAVAELSGDSEFGKTCVQFEATIGYTNNIINRIYDKLGRLNGNFMPPRPDNVNHEPTLLGILSRYHTELVTQKELLEDINDKLEKMVG